MEYKKRVAKHLNRNASTISREVRRNSINGKSLTHIASEIYLNNRMNIGDGLNKIWKTE